MISNDGQHKTMFKENIYRWLRNVYNIVFNQDEPFPAVSDIFRNKYYIESFITSRKYLKEKSKNTFLNVLE